MVSAEAIIVAILGSGALAALINGIFAIKAKAKERANGVSDGVRYLLYDNIKTRGREYIAAGKIELEDLQDIVRAWTVYHDELGGNGLLDKIMSDVKSLPLKGEN